MTIDSGSRTALDTELVVACCTTLYSHPLASWLLGESLHPGGLALTDRLADIAGIGIDSSVLDAGCGYGSSALHLAALRGCEVVGVTLEMEGIAAARRRADMQGLTDAVEFIQADVEDMPIQPGRFDAVLMECVLSTLHRKEETLKKFHESLPAGGRIALSDVTVEGDLPIQFRGIVASALCIGDALSLNEYVDLAQSAGFEIIASEDLNRVATEFVEKLRAALMMAEAAVGLGKLDVSRDTIREVRGHVKMAQAAVEEGLLGYGMVVAQKR